MLAILSKRRDPQSRISNRERTQHTTTEAGSERRPRRKGRSRSLVAQKSTASWTKSFMQVWCLSLRALLLLTSKKRCSTKSLVRRKLSQNIESGVSANQQRQKFARVFQGDTRPMLTTRKCLPFIPPDSCQPLLSPWKATLTHAPSFVVRSCITAAFIFITLASRAQQRQHTLTNCPDCLH